MVKGLLDQIERVKIISDIYGEIPAGALAKGFMDHDIRKAKEAMTLGDTIEMMKCYKKLAEYQL